jgi:hypothetical protein
MQMVNYSFVCFGKIEKLPESQNLQKQEKLVICFLYVKEITVFFAFFC